MLINHILFSISIKSFFFRGMDILIRNGIVDRVYRDIAKRTPRVVKIFFTSSATRLGALDIWSFILNSKRDDQTLSKAIEPKNDS